MKELKILHILWTAQMGGIERLILNLSSAQAENTSLRTSIYIAKNDGYLSADFKNSAFDIHYGKIKSGFSFSLKEIQETTKLFKQFDILHFHFFNPQLAIAAINSKKKVVYTEHGNFGFGQKAKFSKKVARKLQNYFLNKKVDFVTFNSRFTEQTACSRFGLNSVKKTVVYNGVPLLNFTPETAVSTSSTLTIGTIARLANVKRIDRLITAMSLLKALPIQLEIIGDGPNKEQLVEQATKLGCAEKITFLGFDKNPVERMKGWQVCVFPSSGEAFGLVLIEAYQLGLPSIVFTDGGGLAELASQADPELIIENETALAALLAEFLTNPSPYCNPERSNLRKQIAMTFGIDSMEKKFSEIYHQL